MRNCFLSADRKRCTVANQIHGFTIDYGKFVLKNMICRDFLWSTVNVVIYQSNIFSNISSFQETSLVINDELWDNRFYCVKVSGIPSSNKLIKTIWYLHMWRYRWFHWYHVCLLHCKLYLNLFVHHQNIFGSSSKVFGNLRPSSEIFGNSPKMFGNVCLAFKTILENLRKVVGNLRKIIKNAATSMFI